MPSSSVLPLHLVDQVLLYARGLPQTLWALVDQIFHGLLKHPLGRKKIIIALFSLLIKTYECQHPLQKLTNH